MKKQLFLAAALVLTLQACNRPDNKPRSEYIADNEEDDVDNTSRNARDSKFDTLTPADQSENKNDRVITQNIRRALISDDDLSMNAKNVKIMTINGIVTLRGVVDNNQEKSWIERKAKSTSGVKSVDNQLEVKSERGAAHYYN